jgi:hypothetical protein
VNTPLDAFSENLVSIFSDLIESQRAQRLFLLSTAGIEGPDSWWLKSEFRRLGVLHLLVLSGSQVGSLYLTTSTGFWMSGRLLGAGLDWRLWAHRLALLVVFGFCVWTGSSPPIVRATLWILASCAWPNLGFGAQVVLVLSCQVLVFKTPLYDLSLVLSWSVFLVLCTIRKLIQSRLVALMGTTLLAQLACCVIFRQSVWDLNWIQILSSNLVLIVLFDRLVVPLGSLALVLAGLRFFDILGPYHLVLRPIYDIASRTLLVALDELR